MTIAEEASDDSSELFSALGERLARISLEAKEEESVALPLGARGAGLESPSEPLLRNEPSEPPLTAHPEDNVVKPRATTPTLKNLRITH
jgi:hypothetical protein